VILFDGFLKVYMEGRDDEDREEQEGLLPDMKQGEALQLQRNDRHQRFDRPAPRYHRSQFGEEIGRTWHRPSEHLRCLRSAPYRSAATW
jgi:DNA topoisomerase IA